MELFAVAKFFRAGAAVFCGRAWTWSVGLVFWNCSKRVKMEDHASNRGDFALNSARIRTIFEGEVDVVETNTWEDELSSEADSFPGGEGCVEVIISTNLVVENIPESA